MASMLPSRGHGGQSHVAEAGRQVSVHGEVEAKAERIDGPAPTRHSASTVMLDAQHRRTTQQGCGKSRSKERSRDRLPPLPEQEDTTGSCGEDSVMVQTRWLRLQLRKDISLEIVGTLKAHEQGVQDTVAALFAELKFIEKRLAEQMALIKHVAQQGHEQIVEVADAQAMMQRDVIELKSTATAKGFNEQDGELGDGHSPRETGTGETAGRLSPRVSTVAGPGRRTPLPLEPPSAAADALPGMPRKKSPRGQAGEPSQVSYLEGFIAHPAFDAVCAVVIMLNAVHIAVSSELAIRYAVAHPGQGPMVLPAFLTGTSYGFFCFYSAELLLKMFVFRAAYFMGGDARWNVFDLFLVLTSLYSIIADAFLGSGGVNMGWMRLLKLMKMLKMLRVIRVMSFFKELRMIIQAVQGSLVTLLWSMAMLAAILFVFGVCFLQAVSGYLAAAVDGVDAETMLVITRDWSSLSASMTTLLATMSGGCQWQAVAEPLRAAGTMYHLLFLLYICFVFVCVANVFTGIIVDKSGKIATQDYESVVDEIMARDAELQTALYSVFYDMDDDDDGRISDEDTEAVLEDARTRAFLKAFEIEPSDARRLFKMLAPSHDGLVPIEDFCTGLMHVKGAAKSLDIVCLTSDAKKVLASVGGLQTFVQEQFNHMHAFHNNIRQTEQNKNKNR